MAGNRKLRAQVGKAVVHDSTWTDVLGRKDISDPRSIGRAINRGFRIPVILHQPATEFKGPRLLWSLDDDDPLGRACLLEERVIPIKGGRRISRRRVNAKTETERGQNPPLS